MRNQRRRRKHRASGCGWWAALFCAGCFRARAAPPRRAFGGVDLHARDHEQVWNASVQAHRRRAEIPVPLLQDYPGFLDKRSSAAAVTVSMVHHPFVQCRIRPANSTHPPFAGDPASHGRNGHVRTSTRLPRDGFMIAPLMIRYPAQPSLPTSAADSGSLSSGSDDEAS